MVITPRIFVIAVLTGLFWLFALTSALFLVAGVVRGLTGFFWIGMICGAICIAFRIVYRRNESRIRAWVRTR